MLGVVNTLLGLLIFLGAFSSAFWLSNKLATGNRFLTLCLCTVIFFTLVVINSRILSFYCVLSSYLWWFVITVFCGVLSFFIGKRVRTTMVAARERSALEDFWAWYMEDGRLSKIAVFFSTYFVFVISVQLLDILILAPSQGDSFTYIMPRVLFYLQNGNFNTYTTNDFSQIAHVTGWSQIQVFGLMITGRREFGFSIFSLALFCVGLLATMESGRILSGKALGGWISGFVYATAVNVINLSSTPQSDMPIAGFIACGLFGMVFWIDRIRTDKHGAFSMVFAVLVAGSLALAAVMKASALLALAAFAPILVVLACQLFISFKKSFMTKAIGLAFVAALLGIVILVCGGYYANFKNFGHPLGGKEWRAEHEFSNVQVNERIVEGTKNLARYLIHFLSFDGFYTGPQGLKNSLVREGQKVVSDVVKSAFELIGWNLEDSKLSRVPFRYFTEWPPKPLSNSDLSYSGIVFLIAFVMTLFAWYKNSGSVPLNLLAFAIVCGAVLYIFLQSFMALYDPWRGRSFSNLVVMLAPVCGILSYSSGRLWKFAMASLVLLGTLQGASAILFRDSGPLIALKNGQSTIFSPKDRPSQYTRFLDVLSPPKAYELKSALRNYFWLLPPNPKLATTIEGGLLVYPFLFDAQKIDYYKSEREIPLDYYDVALVAQPTNTSTNVVKIGYDLYLWRKENSFRKRDVDDFDPFFGAEKFTGIGQFEGPHGKNGRSFRLMTSPKAKLLFKPVAERSTLFLEVSSVEVPNQIEVFVDEKLVGNIDLIKKGKNFTLTFDLNTFEKKIINVDLKASNSFDDKI